MKEEAEEAPPPAAAHKELERADKWHIPETSGKERGRGRRPLQRKQEAEAETVVAGGRCR